MAKMFMFWRPKKPLTAEDRIPVTVLSGFLGSGKTTLLNRLIADPAAADCAVLVNDLGEVNVDAHLIKRSMRTLKKPVGEVMELTSGCICCSIQTELMDALLHLYEKRRPSHIIIEATGVAEPKAILETLSAANLEKVRGTDFLRLANLITVVDAGSLETHLGTTPSAARAKRHHLLAADRRRPIEELLIEQIECADLIVLNKTDQLETEADIERLASFLRSLNDRAETVACQFGDIDPETVFARERFDIDETLKGARWRKLILSPKGPPQEEPKENEGQAPVFADFAPAPTEDNGRFNLTRETAQKNSHHEDYGLKSFIYESRRPFDEARFLKLLRSGLPGLVRAKGFYWSASAPKEVGLLSIAGKTLRADYIGHWWIDMVADGEVAPDEVPEIAHRCWVEPHGDRRQELVFIGIDLDEAYIRRELKACEVDEQTTKAHPASA